MNIQEAIRARHSVRRFLDQPIEEDIRTRLQKGIDASNTEGNLSIKLVCDEPKAFDSTLAHYGKFSGVQNYLILAGPSSPTLSGRCGYYGERIVLLAQQLGLNTCWVGLTFKKRFVRKALDTNSKLSVVVALGYGTESGSEHPVKSLNEVCSISRKGEIPDWFKHGMDAALLAPTAMNQQKLHIELTDNISSDGRAIVGIKSKGGAYSDVDLGIVRLHFELGAGTENFVWADANNWK